MEERAKSVEFVEDLETDPGKVISEKKKGEILLYNQYQG